MALFRCLGYRLSKQEITLNYESSFINVDATWWGTATKDLTNAVRPIQIKLYAERVLGSATWAGNCTTKFYLFNQSTNQWDFIASVKDETKILDITSITSNQFYTKMKIEVGGTSSNGSVNHKGYAKLLKYYVK